MVAGCLQARTCEQGHSHGAEGCGYPGKSGIAGKEAPVEQRDIRSLGQLPGKSLPLFGKDTARQQGILDRIADAVANDPVILYQPVVGIFRKGQGREVKSVNHRLVQQPQIRRVLPQAREIVGEDIMAEKEFGTIGEIVQFGQLRRPDPLLRSQLIPPFPKDRSQGMDRSLLVGLKINQTAAIKKSAGLGNYIHQLQ